MKTIHNFFLTLKAFWQCLFTLKKVISLSKAEWNIYWPYVNNVWMLKKANTAERRQTKYYLCQLHLKRDWKPEKKTVACQQWQKSFCTAIDCEMKMQIVFQRIKDVMKVKRLSDCHQHCHFLENSDWIKQNSVCCFLVISEVVKNYAVTAVSQNLSAVDQSKKHTLLKKTESHWLSLKNCHNAEAAYKKQNSDTQ